MKVEDVCALTIQWIVGNAGQRNKDRDRDRAPQGVMPLPGAQPPDRAGKVSSPGETSN